MSRRRADLRIRLLCALARCVRCRLRLRTLYKSAQSFDLAAQLLDFVAQTFDLARLHRVLLWASLRQKRLSAVRLGWFILVLTGLALGYASLWMFLPIKHVLILHGVWLSVEAVAGSPRKTTGRSPKDKLSCGSMYICRGRFEPRGPFAYLPFGGDVSQC